MNALALQSNDPDSLYRACERMVQSGFLPQALKTPAQVFAIASMGQELGLGMWQAINGINVIQGKPTVAPQLMLALIHTSGQLEDLRIEGDGKSAICTMKRRGMTAHSETFTFADAERLGLSGKDNYKKQPGTMLKWRAVAACARVVFPDRLMGMYTPEEMGADVNIGEDGNMSIIDAPIDKPQPPALPAGAPLRDATAQRVETPTNSEKSSTATFPNRKALEAWYEAHKPVLDSTEIAPALQVEKVSEFTGGLDAANRLVAAYLQQRDSANIPALEGDIPL